MRAFGEERGAWIVGCLLTVLLSVALSSCATMQSSYHQYVMKGSIVEAPGSDVYLCVGSKDGATVGQELSVYKIITDNSNPKRPAFRREYTGKVKIEEIVDEHFAKAKIVSGAAEKNSIVELSSP